MTVTERAKSRLETKDWTRGKDRKHDRYALRMMSHYDICSRRQVQAKSNANCGWLRILVVAGLANPRTLAFCLVLGPSVPPRSAASPVVHDATTGSFADRKQRRGCRGFGPFCLARNREKKYAWPSNGPQLRKNVCSHLGSSSARGYT